MKKVFFMVLGVLFLVSCHKNNSYTINGTVDNEKYNGNTVYVYGLEEQCKLDSAKVENAKFHLTGSIDKPTAAELIIGEDNLTYFVLEPGDITISTSTKELSGTDLNSRLNQFMKLQIEMQDKIDKTIDEIFAKNLSDEEAEPLLEKINSDFTEKNIEVINQFYNNNQDNALALFGFMYKQFNVENENELLQLVNEAPATISSTAYIQNIKDFFETKENSSEGKMFIDFSVTDENNNTIKLSDHVGKGKYVLVDFWASWCGPCRAIVPQLKSIHKKYKGDNFELLGIAVADELELSKQAVQELEMEWPQILNTKDVAVNTYSIKSIPTLILFGPDGTILKRDISHDDLDEVLADILQ